MMVVTSYEAGYLKVARGRLYFEVGLKESAHFLESIILNIMDGL
jgi:hypothetical protein